MRYAVLALVAFSGAAGAQTRVGPDGITAPGVRIDAAGIHTGSTEVTANGVGVVNRRGTIAVRTNGATRTIDCGGGRLSVEGNRNRLTIANCRAVSVLGNHNVAAVRYTVSGSLLVAGNDNMVRWASPRTVRVGVSAPGSRNTVARR